DDSESPRDKEKIKNYGFAYQPGRKWFYPPELKVQGRQLNDLLIAIPSKYRTYPIEAPERPHGKHHFEQQMQDKLLALEAEVVVLDGLLVILDELVRPGSRFH